MAAKKEKVKKTRKKRRGLKAFLSILIILGAAGTAFWFGWIQIQLGEGEYGVIYTKNGGYDSEPVKNGEFVWRWEGLIPTFMELHIFSLETRSVELSGSGSLPSGDFYAAILGDSVDFDWSIDSRLTYRMSPEALPVLLQEGRLGTELESFYTEYEALTAQRM